MSGETDLSKLLAEMSPVRDPAVYVFATTNAPETFSHLRPLMRFSEAEGETFILEESEARGIAELIVSGKYARITLNVHSALDAVGFLAAACSELAKAGISTNAVAAFYHDHIFVPLERAGDALQVLTDLSAAAAQTPPD